VIGNKIKKWFFINFKVRRYLRYLDRSLQTIIQIDETFFEDTKEIYDQIKRSPRYRKLSLFYSTRQTQVQNHNNIVREIMNEIAAFDFDDILINPIVHEKDEFQKYDRIVKLIDSFAIKSQKFTDFVQNVVNIQKDFISIVEQFALLHDINGCFAEYPNQYLDGRKISCLKERLKRIGERLASYDRKYYSFDKLDEIDDFVEKHNDIYIANHIGDSVFTTADGKEFDVNQRRAILSDDVSSLVIAGAGCGKTFAIVGKIRYLIERQGIEQTDIVAMSFSKNSTEDLETKIKEEYPNVSVSTFHALGLRILEQAKHRKFMIEEQYQAIIESFFRDELRRRPESMRKVLYYYGLYLNSSLDRKKYQDEGALYADLKNADFTTLKDNLVNMTSDHDARKTIKKELVKSYEEMALANFYFVNGVQYIYEAPFVVDLTTSHKRQYTPDFYLPKANIYHEHYGVNRDGKATQFTNEENAKYIEGMAWKRDIHKRYGTSCIETYSYEFSEGVVFEELEQRLRANGVKLTPISAEYVSNALNSIYDGQEFKSFIALVSTFLNLYKANYRDITYFDSAKQNQFGNQHEKMRAGLFLDICKEVYEYYYSLIKANGKIDFDDMISESIAHLDKLDGFRYKYIIVDEFQDISQSRMKFLRKLIAHGNSKLFAVGDDWQSIYRFAGCDVDIILRFPFYFDMAKTHYVTTTFRNSQDLQNIAEPFIIKNPKQLRKHLRSFNSLEQPVQIMYFDDDKFSAFLAILKEIEKYDKTADILVLGRNNRDANGILGKGLRLTNDKKIVSTAHPAMRMEYKTVHGSKGLQRQFVILINLDDFWYGFPNKLEDDDLLSLVLSERDQFAYAEERRLFYVALTRTTSYVFLLANRERPSAFLEEIKTACLALNPSKEIIHNDQIFCPRCKSGLMVVREGPNKRQFYGCSNYPYCTYTISDLQAVRDNRRCPNCGGFLVYRKGPYGSFFGCSNYDPKTKRGCQFTLDYARKRT